MGPQSPDGTSCPPAWFLPVPTAPGRLCLRPEVPPARKPGGNASDSRGATVRGETGAPRKLGAFWWKGPEDQPRASHRSGWCGCRLPRPQLEATYGWGPAPSWTLHSAPPRGVGRVWMGAVLLDTLLACGHWAPRCLLHTLGAEERAPDRPWDSERPCPRGAAATTNPTSQLEASANLVLGCPGGTCWGSRTHPRPGPTAPVARPGREGGPLGLPVVRPPRCSRSAEHPPRRKSSLRASSASSRSPPADSRPEPSSPRASMGPAAATLRPQTFPGLSEATASVAPGRRPSDSGRCWALRPRAALGPGASDRAEGGAAGGRGRGAGRGPGGAETFQGRPPALRGLAGTGRGGAGPGLPAGAGQGPAAPCLRVRSAG